MNRLITLFCLLFIVCSHLCGAEPKVLLQEKFTTPLSADWHWGLGTWKAENGVLRGFESGPRRHGPVQMRKLAFGDAVFEFDFRLENRASFAGIIFNGSQKRGHLFHLYMTTKEVRLSAHPSKNEKVELIRQAQDLKAGEWHRVRIQIKGESIRASVDDKPYSAEHVCIAEQKEAFGLGGDSGGPEGEKAGALLFRNLRVVSEP